MSTFKEAASKALLMYQRQWNNHDLEGNCINSPWWVTISKELYLPANNVRSARVAGINHLLQFDLLYNSYRVISHVRPTTMLRCSTVGMVSRHSYLLVYFSQQFHAASYDIILWRITLRHSAGSWLRLCMSWRMMHVSVCDIKPL